MSSTPVAVIAGLGSGSVPSDEISNAGGTAASFPITSYSTTDINAAFSQIHSHYQGQAIHVALYNAGHGVWKPFLDITPEDVQAVTQTNIEGAFAFSKHIIQAGSLIFTGATASVRGNNIHVSHAIIDGGILTNLARQRRNDQTWEKNEDVRLSPDGIAE
ncbi:NAD(P)-binding protein, partial [Desarmillaria tabescens]